MIQRPVELATANAFVALLHRHHKPVVGHRFSVGAYKGGALVGVAICGRPVWKGWDKLKVLEVTRVCTDGTKNACSFLYGVCARAAREIGFERIQTYILPAEGGVSLRGAGWECEGEQESKPWRYYEAQLVLPGMTNRRTDQPNGNKVRWSKALARKEAT